MDKAYEKGAVLALLFASGDPIDAAKIAEAASLTKKQVELYLSDIQRELSEKKCGIILLRLENRYQLSTDPAYAEPITKMLEAKRNTALSQAAMEVLALVAYNQPVSRAFIDQVRGVDSSSPVSTLLSRNLIREAGRLDLPGRPVSFETTDAFLRSFSISSLDELPPIHGFDDLFDEESGE